jgi:hypothetical protein
MQALWHALLTYVRDRNILVEGPLHSLRICNVPLSKPAAIFDRRAFLLGTKISSRYRPPEFVVHPEDSAATAATAKASAHQKGVPSQPFPPPMVPPQLPNAPTCMVPPQQVFAGGRAPMSALAANPYAMAPVLMPQGIFTQDMHLSLEQLSQRGMSLAAFGQMMMGPGSVASGIGEPSQGYLEAALPELRGFMNGNHGNAAAGQEKFSGPDAGSCG